jgi:flagellar basal body-associated protein FliL
MIDQTALVIITLLLVAMVGYSVWQSRKRESYVPYDETTCIALAQKNEANIKALTESADKIKNLGTQVIAIESQVKTNTDAISQIVQQYKP